MKKLLVMIALFCTFLSVSYAIDLPLRIVVNGEKINFPDAQPFIDENGRTQVPVRFVSEALGGTVDWNESEKTVVVGKQSNNIKLSVNKREVEISSVPKLMDTAPIMKDSRVYVPIRVVSEAFGASVRWDEDVKTAYIDFNNEVKPTTQKILIMGVEVESTTDPAPKISREQRNNGYYVPENSQLHVTGKDDFVDQGFMISFYKKDADIKQQILDLRAALESKFGSAIANEVYEHVKGKDTPQYNVSEKFIKVESTNQLIWIQSSPEGLKTVNVVVSLPNKNFDRK